MQVRTDGTVATVRAGKTFGGALLDLAKHPFSGGALTAHLKRDPQTGERIGVTYPSAGAPGARVTTFSADGEVVSDVMIPLAGKVCISIYI